MGHDQGDRMGLDVQSAQGEQEGSAVVRRGVQLGPPPADPEMHIEEVRPEGVRRTCIEPGRQQIGQIPVLREAGQCHVRPGAAGAGLRLLPQLGADDHGHYSSAGKRGESK